MADFQAKHFSRSFTHTVPAAPDRVFTLLCPVREYDWIDGWAAELVYSSSGYAEEHCVFRTNLPNRGKCTWVVTRHEPDQHRIGFAIFCPETYVERLDIQVRPDGEGRSSLTWTRTYTGLSAEGNEYLEHYIGELIEGRMAGTMRALEHYCATGEMLRAGH